jgi:hypothetical protein
MRPDSLYSLPMRHPYAVHIGEIVRCLTCCSVAGDMEFWNCNAEGFEGPDFKRGYGGVFREAMQQILAPLATNVVRDDNVGNAGFDIIREGRRKGVIDVDVSRTGVSVERGDSEVGYLSPFCRSTTPCGRTNAWRHDTAATPITA